MFLLESKGYSVRYPCDLELHGASKIGGAEIGYRVPDYWGSAYVKIGRFDDRPDTIEAGLAEIYAAGYEPANWYELAGLAAEIPAEDLNAGEIIVLGAKRENGFMTLDGPGKRLQLLPWPGRADVSYRFAVVRKRGT